MGDDMTQKDKRRIAITSDEISLISDLESQNWMFGRVLVVSKAEKNLQLCYKLHIRGFLPQK